MRSPEFRCDLSQAEPGPKEEDGDADKPEDYRTYHSAVNIWRSAEAAWIEHMVPQKTGGPKEQGPSDHGDPDSQNCFPAHDKLLSKVRRGRAGIDTSQWQRPHAPRHGRLD